MIVLLFFVNVLSVFFYFFCSANPYQAEVQQITRIIERIKQDSPEIEKYFLFDRTGELIVKADLNENFQVQYDLKHLVSAGSGGDVDFWVPFSVKNVKTGEGWEDTLLWEPQKDASGILLSFDDHYWDEWTRHFDLFDRYNARATFFIIGANFPFSSMALERGHDIGYHTYRHSILPGLSSQAFFIEAVSQVNYIRNNGVPLIAFAYPFGLYESWMHEQLLNTFSILRGFNISFQAYDPAAIRDGLVFSRSVDNHFFEHDEDFKAAIDIMFRTAKFTAADLVVPISSHIISETAEWGIKPHRLEYILQTASDLQLNFYRYRDFF